MLLQNFIELFIVSAPWLLLGLLVAGVMNSLVPVALLQKHMGQGNFSSILKSALIGAPLPLCSCGVIPAAVGLRRGGASKPATISFLVATPETGVDSVSVSYALLGPLFAIVRPIAAVLSAIYAGILVRILGGAEQEPVVTPATKSSCCSHQTKTTSCSSTKTKPTKKWREVWQFSTGKLLNDITVWLLIGLALAAVIKTFVPTDMLTQWGSGFLAMVAMAVVGIPMYICATASTPVAVGFLAAGLSPGAVLVFLLAGPATNISTMGMIAKEMGKRTLAIYLFSVMSISIALGYALNWLITVFQLEQWVTTASEVHAHDDAGSVVYILSAILLGALMVRNNWSKLVTKLGKGKGKSSPCCH